MHRVAREREQVILLPVEARPCDGQDPPRGRRDGQLGMLAEDRVEPLDDREFRVPGDRPQPPADILDEPRGQPLAPCSSLVGTSRTSSSAEPIRRSIASRSRA